MLTEPIILFILLFITLVMFMWEKWRYDVVALALLIAVSLLGFTTFEEAFSGFGHPAVIIVAGVLVVSHGLLSSGVIDGISRRFSLSKRRPLIQILILSASVAFASAFVSNIGALALFVPIAIRTAKKSGVSPSLFLMPLAFSSHLGGYVTLIGAAPNIIVSGFRADAGLGEYNIFDFATVGLPLAVVGVLFLSLIGWRLLPKRSAGNLASEILEQEDYVTELTVPEDSALIGKNFGDLRDMAGEDFAILALVRNGRRTHEPSRYDHIHQGDTLIVQAESEALKSLTESTGLEFVGNKSLNEGLEEGDDIGVSEVVVTPNALIVGKSVEEIGLRQWYNVNLLAISRHGERLRDRLAQVQILPSDVLILQGAEDQVARVCKYQGCLPLAERELRLGQPKKIALAVSIFLGAVIIAALGVLPAHFSFLIAAVAMVVTGVIPIKELYESIDWSVVVLLGAMVQIGFIFRDTEAAQILANFFLLVAEYTSPVVLLAIVLITTTLISDLINSTTVTVLMAPIAILIAQGIGAHIDPFLIAVAIGASSSYLTPVGHQSNVLVMGPGGYKFSDYWRIGLPLEILITIVSVPLILHMWPLF